jgi:hypothetical protein
MGFAVLRRVRGFSGPINVFQEAPELFDVRHVDSSIAMKMSQSFGDWRATWQNGFGAFDRAPDDVVFHGLFQNQVPIGLGCFDRSNGSIRHLCFESGISREAAAEHLIASFLHEKNIVKSSYMNIDESYSAVIHLLLDRGWENLVDQFEMSYRL